MRVRIEALTSQPSDEVRVGNVYSVRGGRGARNGNMNVVIYVTETRHDGCVRHDPTVLMLTVDREGRPVGVTQYGLHYVQDLQPIAFVDGLDGLEFVMRSL